jgi:VanZ family protein
VRILAVLYAVLLLAIVALADVGLLGPVVSGVHAIPMGDKVCHLVLAAVLGHLAAAFPGAPRLGGVPSGTVFVAVVALLEESSQRFIPGRTFDLLDLAADAIGIALGTWLALRREHGRRREH